MQEINKLLKLTFIHRCRLFLIIVSVRQHDSFILGFICIFCQPCRPGGGTAIYGLYRYVPPALEGMVFNQFTLGPRSEEGDEKIMGY